MKYARGSSIVPRPALSGFFWWLWKFQAIDFFPFFKKIRFFPSLVFVRKSCSKQDTRMLWETFARSHEWLVSEWAQEREWDSWVVLRKFSQHSHFPLHSLSLILSAHQISPKNRREIRNSLCVCCSKVAPQNREDFFTTQVEEGPWREARKSWHSRTLGVCVCSYPRVIVDGGLRGNGKSIFTRCNTGDTRDIVRKYATNVCAMGPCLVCIRIGVLRSKERTLTDWECRIGNMLWPLWKSWWRGGIMISNC